MSRWELGVLGPTVVVVGGEPVPLRPRELDLVAALALTHPEPAGHASIVRALWPEGAPRSARQAIQNHVARIRRSLGDDALSTVAGGYGLGPGWALDTEQFDDNIARARRAALDNDHSLAALFLQQAVRRVRGDAFAGLDDSVVSAERARRHQSLMAAEDELVVALLAGGDVTEAVGLASALVEQEPFRDARWLMLALAEYRSGQRRQCLLTLQRARETLLGAGLNLGPALAPLEALVLGDDIALLSANPASLVGQHPMSSTHHHDAATVFVGRTGLLDEVRRRLAEVVAHRSALTIELAGSPGIGKSTLASRIATRAMIDGWHVVSASCYPGGTRLLEPLGELVRQIMAYEPNPADTFDASLLTDLATLWRAQPARPARGDLGEATLDAIRHHADRYPTLVVIDDAHHLSETAARLLTRVRAMTVPVVVLTVRSATDGDDSPADHDVSLDIAGLDEAEAQRLLELLSRRRVTAAEASRVHTATGGNPLLLRHVALSGEAVDPVPDGIPGGAGGQILLAALRRLPPRSQAVAAVLAVAGGPTSVEVVASTAQLSDAETRRGLGEAEAGGVLRVRADGRADLISEMLRDALLAELTEQSRIELHERLGSAIIASGGDVLMAAPHVLAAAKIHPERAIAVAAAAAMRAGEATMHPEAAAFLETASQLAARHLGPQHPTTLRLRLDRAEQLRRIGDPAHIDIVWDVVRAAETVGDHEIVAVGATALCQLGPLTEAGTLNTEIADLVERAIANCTTPAIRAQCAGQATLFYSMSGRVDRCRALFQDAIEQARLAEDDPTLLHVLGNVYISLNHPDDWPLRAELAGEMLALAEKLDDDDARFQALHLYFSTQVQFGDPLLRTTFAAQQALTSSLRSAARRWMLGYQAACLAHLDGRLDDALRIGTETFGSPLVARSRQRAGYWMNMLVVRLAQGREQELVVDIDAIVDAQPGLPGWRAVAAWLAALRGDHDRVLHECDVLAHGAGLPRDMTWSGAAMLLGRAVAASGDAERIAALRELLLPHTALMTWIGSCTVGPFDVALAELALAEGDRSAAAGHVASAQRMVDRLKAPVFQPDLDRIRSSIS